MLYGYSVLHLSYTACHVRVSVITVYMFLHLRLNGKKGSGVNCTHCLLSGVDRRFNTKTPHVILATLARQVITSCVE